MTCFFFFFSKLSLINKNDLCNQSKINIFNKDYSGSRQSAPYPFPHPPSQSMLNNQGQLQGEETISLKEWPEGMGGCRGAGRPCLV